jgi:ABC-type nickel/cobalt efflux system permease component RcnA
MNWVLLGFGIALIIIGLVFVQRSLTNSYMASTAAFSGLGSIGVGILICIVAGWLIEREYMKRKRKSHEGKADNG